MYFFQIYSDSATNLLTIRSLQDVDRILSAAQLTLHVEMTAIRIAAVRICGFSLGQIVPFIRLFPAVAALDFDEECIVRMARLQFVHILQCGLDLERDFHHCEKMEFMKMSSDVKSKQFDTEVDRRTQFDFDTSHMFCTCCHFDNCAFYIYRRFINSFIFNELFLSRLLNKND